MHDKSKKVDLEDIAGPSNQPAPAPEVKKKKRGWLNKNKSKSEENAKKEVSDDGEPSKVKIISVKPKNADETTNGDNKNENPEEVQELEAAKAENDPNEGTSKDDEIEKVEEIQSADQHPSRDNRGPVTKWYHKLLRRSPKKNKTNVTPAIATLIENMETAIVEIHEVKITDNNEGEAAESEAVLDNPGPSSREPAENAAVKSPKPKRNWLNSLRRTKSKNEEKVSPTETVVEDIEIYLNKDGNPETNTDDAKPENDKPAEDDKIENTEDKIENSPTVESYDLPVPANSIEEEVDETDKPSTSKSPKDVKPKQSEVIVTADIKRQKFSLTRFFNYFTKSNRQSTEKTMMETLSEDIDANVAETNENGSKDENAANENVEEVIIEEIETSSKNDDPSEAAAIKDEDSPIEEATNDKQAEETIGDSANVGDVQAISEPKIDENLPIDDNAEKSVKMTAEPPVKEIEQK